MTKEEETDKEDKDGPKGAAKAKGAKSTKSKRGNIYKVAERAGVSFVTVSRVFNNHEHVSDKMREKVLAAAREVGYSPKLVANPNTIGLLVRDDELRPTNVHQQRVLLHLIQAAAAKDYYVRFITPSTMDQITQKHLNGLVAVGLSPRDLMHLEQLPEIPIVQSFAASEVDEWNSISYNYRQEVLLGLEHLQALKHERIALIVRDLDRPETRERYQAFVENMPSVQDGDGPVDLRVFVLRNHSVEEVAHAMVEGGYTAALYLSIESPMCLFNALIHDCGLRIPEQFSFVALEVPGINVDIRPALTSIVQPVEEVARAAIDSILRLIDGKKSGPRMIFQNTLAIRGSTAECKKFDS